MNVNDWLWAITAVLAVLLVPAAGLGFQHVTRNHNQQGEK